MGERPETADGNAADRWRQCVILVGGRGTRLGALTEAVPKPLLPVGGKPFLEYLVFEARRHGFTHIILLAGYRGEALTAAAENLARRYPELKIDVVIEPEPLGTGGAVRFARDKLAPEFLLMNGDSLFDINLLDLATRPVAGPWSARIALKPGQDPARYGAVDVSGDRITLFREKHPSSDPATINGGVYWIKREAIDDIPAGTASIERDVFPRLAAAGALRGFAYDRFMLDIGLPESLATGNDLIPQRTTRAAVFFDRDGVLNVDRGYVHKSDQFEWIDGAVSAIKAVNDAGRFAFVVTNQAGVAHGYYDERQVHALHEWINDQLRHSGAHIDAFMYCPHHPEATRPAYRMACACRKPNPGMLTTLMSDWPILRDRSFLIGDRDTDLKAAAAASISGHLFAGGSLQSVVERLLVP